MEWRTKKGAGAEHVVNEKMIAVFGAIVEGERTPKRRGQAAQSGDETAAKFGRAAASQNAELGKARFPLVNDEQNTTGFVIADGVDFPMSRDAAQGNGGRTF